MSQTSYSTLQLVAFAGQLGDIGPHDIGTFTNSILSSVPFGIAVSADPTNGDAHFKLPAASGDLDDTHLLGVTAATQAIENLVVGGGSYKQYAAVGVMKKGRVWVQVEEAVVAFGPVYVRVASGAGGTQQGAFRTSADTATAILVSNGMRYLTSAAAQGFALLEVSLP